MFHNFKMIWNWFQSLTVRVAGVLYPQKLEQIWEMWVEFR